jgi:hypothetical protein
MAYSKAELKCNSYIASLCFRVFWIGCATGQFLPLWTLLEVLLKHILIILTSFIGIDFTIGYLKLILIILAQLVSLEYLI